MMLSLIVHSMQKKNGFVFKADFDMGGGCVIEYGRFKSKLHIYIFAEVWFKNSSAFLCSP